MKLTVLILFCSISQGSFAQLKINQLQKNDVPASATYLGKLKQAIRWTDKNGDNLLVLTETGETESKNAADDSYRDAALYAYHFALVGDSARPNWRVYDFVRECPVDISLNFVENSLALTDLDNNGKAEIWMMYKIGCQGDVSPVPMKIIMYENNKKYAARGESYLKLPEGEAMGGTYRFDDAFKRAPAVFRQYADQLWQKNNTY